MDMHPSLPQNLWESTPPEVRAYIGTLETRLSTLELMVEALQSKTAPYKSSSTKLRAIPRVRRRAIRHSLYGPNVHGASAVVAANRGTKAIRAPLSRWKRSMRWWCSNPISVAVATRRYQETMPHRSVIKSWRFRRSSPSSPNINGISWCARPAVRRPARPGLRGFPVAPMAPCPRHSGALYGIVSPVQAHHDSGDG